MNIPKLIALSIVTATLLNANDTIKLSDITISSATKTEKKIDGVAASVEVITQADIERMGAESLKDVLKNTPGLTIQYGTFPNASSKSKSSINIRGLGAKGTLFLLDGRRLGGEVSNPYDLDRIPAGQIEKIEIVKGPMSTLYGADATGGIINIITKKPTSGKPQIDLGIRYGQNKDGDNKNKNINLAVKGKEAKLSYSFYINKTDTTPYTQKENADIWVKTPPPANGKAKPSTHPAGFVRTNGLQDSYLNEEVTYKEDSDIITYGTRLEYDFNDMVSAGLDINYFKEERSGQYIGYFHPANFNNGAAKLPVYNIPVNTKDDNKRLDTAVDFKINVSDDLIINLRAYRSDYKKRNTTTAKYWEAMGYNSEDASSVNGLRGNAEVTTLETSLNYFLNNEHLITAGAEKRKEERDTTIFSQSNNLTSKSVDYKALYIQDEWMIDESLNTIFGLRYDSISNNNSKTTFKVGAIKNFSKEFNARFNIAQGYRAPDMKELYIFKNTANGMLRGADTIDTALGKTVYDLKPESTLTYEIGINGQVDSTKYDFAVFYNDIEDLIDEVNTGAYYTYQNIPNAKTYGLELNLAQEITKNFSANFNWSELRTKNQDTNKELEFNPKRVISLNLAYEINKDLNSSITTKYTAEQYYLETINRGAPTQITVDSYTNSSTTLDWNINYNYNKFVTLMGGINNLTDETIDNILGSSSGRYYFAKVNISF